MSNETMTLKVIAHIHTAFPTKFGIPRQSGLVDGLPRRRSSSPEARTAADALRGLEDFEPTSGWCGNSPGAVREAGLPTVRPRAWAATHRMGVFCHPLPFRPIRWALPALGPEPSSTGRTLARCSSCEAQT